MPYKFLQFVLSINSSIVFCLANSPPMHASYFNFRAFSSIKWVVTGIEHWHSMAFLSIFCYICYSIHYQLFLHDCYADGRALDISLGTQEEQWCYFLLWVVVAYYLYFLMSHFLPFSSLYIASSYATVSFPHSTESLLAQEQYSERSEQFGGLQDWRYYYIQLV